MRAVWVRARTEVRARWRAILGLGILIGLLAGGGAAATAAARRTDSAFPRFLEHMRAAHVEVPNFDGTAIFPPEELARMPEVEAIERRRAGAFLVPRPDADELPEWDSFFFVPYEARQHDPVQGPVERVHILEGRAPHPDRADEALVTNRGLEDLGFGVGDRLVPFMDEDFQPGLAAALRDDPIELQIVGVAVIPSTFPPQVEEGNIALILTPAFYERYPQANWHATESAFLRLTDGPAGVPSFRRALEARASDELVLIADRASINATIAATMRVRSVPLWILAGILGAVLVLVVGQAVVRASRMESEDVPALRALGFTPVQFAAGGMVRYAVAAVAAVPLIAALCIGVSAATPTGPARLAETAPGVMVDPWAIGIWCGGAFAFVSLVAGTSALSVARRRARERPSNVAVAARLAEAAGLPPSATSGLRLAFGQRARATGSSGRATVAGLSTGIVALVAALTFGASLDRLLAEPRLTGVTWDALIQSDSRDFAEYADALAAVPEFEGIAISRGGYEVSVNGESVPLESVETIKGGLAPVLIEGSLPSLTHPSEPTQAMLGTATMRRLGATIGDIVTVGLPGFAIEVQAQIVGRGIVVGGGTSRLGDGILLHPEAVLRIESEAGAPIDNSLLLNIPDRMTVEDLYEPLAAVLGDDFYPYTLSSAADIAAAADARGLNMLLAALLTVVSVAALTHGIVSALRTHRTDLATLKALGFDRGQVKRAVAVQVSVLALASLALAVPLGLVVGRWGWQVFADFIGVGAGPSIPMAVLLIIPAAIVAANLVAVLPARAAARAQPAAVLRTE